MAIVPKKRRKRKRGVKAGPRTVEQYRALPAHSQEVWNRVAHVVTDMRRGSASLRTSAAEHGVDPRTVKRLAAGSLRKTPSGRYAANAGDRLPRLLLIPTPQGLAEIATRGSREATKLAKYWNAVHDFLETGDSSGLERFAGHYVTNASGERVPLLTDLDELERLGSAGVLSFESIYARIAR